MALELAIERVEEEQQEESRREDREIMENGGERKMLGKNDLGFCGVVGRGDGLGM